MRNAGARGQPALARVAFLAALAIGLLAGNGPTVQAQTNGTWTRLSAGDASGDWDTASNWSGTNIADGVGAIANFSTLNITVNSTVTLDSHRTIGGLSFADATTASSNWTLLSTNNSVLTLQVASGVPTITVTNQTATIGLVLDGAQGLNKLGAGTLVLSATNLFTGDVSIGAGTLSIGNDAHLGDIGNGLVFAGGTLLTTADITLDTGRSVTLNSTGLFNVASLTSLTVGQSIGGAGGLTKLGAGTLQLSGNNLYAGLTTVSAGTLVLSGTNAYLGNSVASGAVLSVNSDAALGASSGGITLSGGTLLTTADMSSARNVTLSTTSTINVDTGTIFTLSSNLTGSGGLTKAGAGTLLMTGDSSYAGVTAISAGTLRLGADGSLPSNALSIGAAGTFDLGGFDQTVGTLTLAAGGQIALGAGTLSFVDASSTISGGISGAGKLVKTGTGTLTFNAANSFTGGLTILAGNVHFQGGGGAGAGTGLITLGGGNANVQMGATSSATVPNDVFIPGTGTGTVTIRAPFATAGNSTNSINGDITFQKNFTFMMGTNTNGTAGPLVNIGGAVQEDGDSFDVTFSAISAGAAEKNASEFRLNSGANWWTGATTILGGRITANAANALPAASALVLNPFTGTAQGARVVVNAAQTVGSLSGSNGIVSISTSVLMNAGVDHTDTTYAGQITGAGSFAKLGSGVMTLTGTSSISGNVTVQQGAINLSGAGGNLSGFATLVLRSQGTLVLDNAAAFNGNRLRDAGAVSLNGGQLQLVSFESADTDTTETLGTVTAAAGATNIDLFKASNSSLTSTVLTITSLAAHGTTSASTLNFSSSGGQGALGTAGAGNARIMISAGVTADALIGGWATVNGRDFAYYDSTGGTGVKALGTILGARPDWSAAPTGNVDIITAAPDALAADATINSLLVSASAATLIDLGGFTLGITNSGLIRTGGNLTLQNGTLRQGGTAASGLWFWIDSATTTINATITNNTGALTLAKSGAGTLILGSSNSYTGGTVVNQGILSISNNDQLGATTGGLTLVGGTLSATADISSARAITFSGGAIATANSVTLTLSGVRTGTLGLIKSGPGTLELAGTALGYTGNTIIQDGTLALTMTGSPTVNLTTDQLGDPWAGDLLIANPSGVIRLNLNTGSFSGGGEILVQTSGTQITDTGTNVRATIGNNIVLNSGNADPTNFVVHLGVVSFGTMVIDGVISGNSALNLASTTSGGAGLLILKAQNSYTGDTTINHAASGIIRLGIDNALPTGTALTFGTQSGAGPGVLDLHGFDQTVGSLAFGGQGTAANAIITNNTLSASSSVFTVGGSTTPANAFSGILQDGANGGTIALVKAGTGTLTLWGANAYSGGTTISGGILAIAADGNLGTSTGTVQLNGGTLRWTGSDATLAATRSLSTTSTTSTIDVVANTLTIGQSITGSGALTKSGAGTLRLAGTNNTYAGGSTISAGTLIVDGTLGTGGGTVAVATNGTLAGSGSIQRNATIDGNGVINFSGGTITGTLAVTGGAWTGTGTVSGAITQTAGTFNLTGSGTLTTGSTVSVSGGTFHVLTGATLNNSGIATVTGSATLSANGTIAGGVIVGSGGTLHGNGTIGGPVTVQSGGFLSAGNSIGHLTVDDDLTWNSGSNQTFEISDADMAGTPGTDWDLITVNGELTLNATPSSKINLTIDSWPVGDPLDNFIPWDDYSWLWITTTGGIDVGGYPVNDLFGITLGSEFAGDFSDADVDSFSVSRSLDGLSLFVNYAFVPEPGSLLLVTVAAASIGWYGRHRRRKLPLTSKA